MLKKNLLLIVGLVTLLSFSVHAQRRSPNNSFAEVNPAKIFENPPQSAKPGVLWMWMGSNLSKDGITRDLEALKKQALTEQPCSALPM